MSPPKASPPNWLLECQWLLNPPIVVRVGDTVEVMFYANGSDNPQVGAVSGIYPEDVEPGCQFVASHGHVPVGASTWDYMARLHVH